MNAMNTRGVKRGLLTLVGVMGLVAFPVAQDEQDAPFARVLLISVDGLHQVDLEQYVTTNPSSALAYLSAHGRTYTNASATKPSDSFPGMLAMVTGGTPRSTGVYYDDGYDRSLAPANGPCVIGTPGPGTRAQWKQNLDNTPLAFPDPDGWLHYATFWPTFSGTTLKESVLPLDPANGCARVYPHQFPRVNNVFELIKAAGGRTAWSDKHPAYEFLKGPSGSGLDDLYTPEIATTIGGLPLAIPPVPGVLITNSFSLTRMYDDLKVTAILSEIDGFDHSGTTVAPVPTLFGMNFQAVSVAQKLIQSGVVGGYLDTSGTPSQPLQTALDHMDASIGAMVSELSSRGLLDSTLIIISAKHGNSPMAPIPASPCAVAGALCRVDPAVLMNIVNCNSILPCATPARLALLSADTGPLIWLKDQNTTAAVVAALNDSVTSYNPPNPAHIAGILAGTALTDFFGVPANDSRVPDIVIAAIPGTVYTTSLTKIADHGGFGDDDVHVALLVSNPTLPQKTIDDPVETRQIACTILKAVTLDCGGLMSEQIEPSKFLPHSNHRNVTSPSVANSKRKR
jgi:hypothetical protein